LSERTVFSPEVQDAMFAHRISWRLGKSSSMEGKVKQLRLEWDGFNRVPDADLVRAIEAFQQGTPIEETTLGNAVTEVSERPVRRTTSVEPIATTEQTPMETPERRRSSFPVFDTLEEVQEAIDSGEIKQGEFIILNGEPVKA